MVGSPARRRSSFGKVGAGELPLERHGGGLVAVLKGEEARLNLGQRGEVIGREDFALDDGEVDFDLVEPRGMNGQVQQAELGPVALQAVMDAWPRWQLPLSTTQKTRSAER